MKEPIATGKVLRQETTFTRITYTLDADAVRAAVIAWACEYGTGYCGTNYKVSIAGDGSATLTAEYQA